MGPGPGLGLEVRWGWGLGGRGKDCTSNAEVAGVPGPAPCHPTYTARGRGAALGKRSPRCPRFSHAGSRRSLHRLSVNR